MSESDVMPDVYIPNVGFRQAGLRLEHPVSTERDGRRLTIMELVSTDKGTDLLYEFTSFPEERKDPHALGGHNELVVLRDGEREYGCDPKAFGSSETAARYNWAVRRRMTLLPIPVDLRRVEIRLSGKIVGEWSLFLELVPFDADPAHEQLALEASDTREGITITVRGIDASVSGTAVNIEAASDTPLIRPLSIGGLSGMRDGITALTLRDDKGRTYPERARPEDGSPDPSGRTDVALFDPLPADARALELEIPFVFVDDEAGRIDVDLPVSLPVEATLDRSTVRVMSTAQADPSNPWNRGPALGVSLDLGGWHGDRRVLKPLGVVVDGTPRGMSYGRGINSVAPEPVEYIETPLEHPLDAKHLVLTGATVQVRGPWRVKFRR